MSSRVLFITGTDTGVGKTVLAVLLTSYLRQRGVEARAVKPFCSGDREDAQVLRWIQENELALDDVNPWHFRAALTPLLAARREGTKVNLAETVTFLREARHSCEALVVEGAGGLLSPLGEGFDSRDLITALKAVPVIVAPNRLGCLNHVLLTLQALPPVSRNSAHAVLVNPPRATAAIRTNPDMLAELIGNHAVHVLPWHSEPMSPARLRSKAVRQVLEGLCSNRYSR